MTARRKGPRRMIEEDGRVSLLDIGTVAQIRDGRSRFAARSAAESEDHRLRDIGAEPFDAVILATGFRPDLRPLLPDVKGVLSDTGEPLVERRPTAEPGLFFCGAIASPTGQLREIGIEATRIADAAEALLAAR